MDQRPRPTENTQPVRKSVSIALVLVLVVAIGALLAYILRPPGQSQDAAVTSRTDQQGDRATGASDRAVRTPANATEAKPNQPPPRSLPAPPVATTPNTPAVSPEVRGVINSLVQLNLTNGPLTPEKLATWQKNLQQLTNSGPAAVPAIREFLQSKQDMSFETIGGSAAVGHASMRMAMFDTLVKIGGPEAMLALGESLRSTREPREIGYLARNLEQLAPGEYAEPAVESARAALADAQAGKLGKTDVAALFGVLQDYGGASAVQDLIDTKGRWTYYSAIALGGLSEGAGVPGLVQMAQDTSPSGRVNRSAALQVLAQMATDSPAARQALLDQARTSQIHTAIWMKMSVLLGGEQLLLGGGPDTGLAPTEGPRASSYHISGGNQNFYTTSILDKLTPDQINQRVQLIDQLLTGNSDAAAVESLQRARTTLAERLKGGPK